MITLYYIDFLIFLSVFVLLYLVYIFIVTGQNVQKLAKDHLLQTIVEDLNKQNSENLNKIERRLKANTMIYIDNGFNRINEGIDTRIERLIKENKT